MICHNKTFGRLCKSVSKSFTSSTVAWQTKNRRIKSYLVIERAKTLKHRKRKREEKYKDTVMLWWACTRVASKQNNTGPLR